MEVLDRSLNSVRYPLPPHLWGGPKGHGIIFLDKVSSLLKGAPVVLLDVSGLLVIDSVVLDEVQSDLVLCEWSFKGFCFF